MALLIKRLKRKHAQIVLYVKVSSLNRVLQQYNKLPYLGTGSLTDVILK
jgi:hypothetical protein